MQRDSIIAFDLETTGFDPNTREIIHIGAVSVDVLSGEFRTASMYISPAKGIPAHITKLTGLTDQVIADKGATPLAAALATISEMISGARTIVGHNIKAFDNAFLAAAGIPVPVKLCWDTFKVMKATAKQAKRYNLSAALEYYKVTGMQADHSALNDAFAALAIYKRQSRTRALPDSKTIKAAFKQFKTIG